MNWAWLTRIREVLLIAPLLPIAVKAIFKTIDIIIERVKKWVK